MSEHRVSNEVSAPSFLARRKRLGMAMRLAAGLGIAVVMQSARADSLDSNSATMHSPYVAIEELSYEVIVHANDSMRAEVEYRVAIRNSSRRIYDGLLRLAMPRNVHLVSAQAGSGGIWISGRANSSAADDSAANRTIERSDSKNGLAIFVRDLEATAEIPFPIVEVLVENAPPQEVIQLSIRMEVLPELHLDRWQIVFPSREIQMPHLVAKRSFLVKHQGAIESFWLDGESNRGAPSLVGESNIPQTLAWPARARMGTGLALFAEVLDEAQNVATCRVSARLGQLKPLRPDHVSVLVDHSNSTGPNLSEDALRVMQRLSEELGPQVTMDLIAFARTPTPLFDRAEDDAPHYAKGPDEVAQRIAHARSRWPGRESGSDLNRALRLARARLATQRAKRPAILVLTDAMLARQAALDWANSDSSKIPIFMVVDDPFVALLGFSAEQPTIDLAAQIGAKISIESLEDLLRKSNVSERIFASPPVLRNLKLNHAIENTTEGLPKGMIGGQVIHAQYKARPRIAIRLSGEAGGRSLRSASIVPKTRERIESIAISFAGPSNRPFEMPAWVLRSTIRRSDVTIARATRRTREVHGNLDEELFLEHLRYQVVPRARACYNHALARKNNFAAHVVLNFEVGVGEVAYARIDEATLTHREPEFITCVREAAWKLQMPAASLDIGVYEVTYPLRFTPPEREESAIAPADLKPLFVQIMAGPHPDAAPTKADPTVIQR
jgi:hypothetical protein